MRVERTLPAGGGSDEALATQVTLACLFEVAAEKPGNITPTHDFRDATWGDMARSALALGSAFGADRVRTRSVGELIADGVAATAAVTAVNTNLGIVLLLAPLARASVLRDPGEPLRAAVIRVLDGLTVTDAAHAFAAIAAAAPGGLGDAAEHDVRAPAAVTLRTAMAAAADRDRVAAEYAHGYPVVFEHGLPALRAALDGGQPTLLAVQSLFLELLAAFPDTLIARKAGTAAARAVSELAARTLAGARAGERELGELTVHLRGPDHRLNPGTTADLVAATLLAGQLEGVRLA